MISCCHSRVKNYCCYFFLFLRLFLTKWRLFFVYENDEEPIIFYALLRSNIISNNPSKFSTHFFFHWASDIKYLCAYNAWWWMSINSIDVHKKIHAAFLFWFSYFSSIISHHFHYVLMPFQYMYLCSYSVVQNSKMQFNHPKKK